MSSFHYPAKLKTVLDVLTTAFASAWYQTPSLDTFQVDFRDKSYIIFSRFQDGLDRDTLLLQLYGKDRMIINCIRVLKQGEIALYTMVEDKFEKVKECAKLNFFQAMAKRIPEAND